MSLLSASFDFGQRACVVAGLLMIFMALSFFGLRGWHRVAVGFGRLTRSRCAAYSAARPRGAACLRCSQRLSAVSAGLRHGRPGREHL